MSLGTAMNWYILIFMLVGALFGILTYSNRHLFSEAWVKRADGTPTDFLDSRLWWTMQSCFFWPLLLVAGVYTFRAPARRR